MLTWTPLTNKKLFCLRGQGLKIEQWKTYIAMDHSTSYKYNQALFRSKKFLDFDTVALSFLFDKSCPIME